MSATGLGIGLALVAATFYGVVPNLTRLAFNHGIPAIETVLFRTLAVALVLGFAARLGGERLRVPAPAWPDFLAQALATLLVSTCYLASVQFLPVGLAVIIFYAFPVLIMLLAPFVEGRRPSGIRIGVAVMAFAGLVLATGVGSPAFNVPGIVLAGIAAVACAGQFFSGRRLARHMAPAVFGSLVHVAILPVVLAIVLFADGGFLLPGAGSTAALAVAGVGLAYVAAYFLHMSSVKVAPSSIVAPYFNFEPVVATVIAVFLLDERLTPNQLAGAGLVIAALVAAGFIRDQKDQN